MYYILESNAPDGMYPAQVSYRPDRPFRSWIMGTRFDPPMQEPVVATARFRRKSVLKDLILVPVPLMVERLCATLLASGVSNLDVYRAEIHDKDSDHVYRDHVAFNVVGVVAAADMAKSEFSAPDGPLVSVDFTSVSIDERKTGGLLMFRLAESVNALVVHQTVKEAIEAAGFETVVFVPPERWMG